MLYAVGPSGDGVANPLPPVSVDRELLTRSVCGIRGRADLRHVELAVIEPLPIFAKTPCCHELDEVGPGLKLSQRSRLYLPWPADGLGHDEGMAICPANGPTTRMNPRAVNYPTGDRHPQVDDL